MANVISDSSVSHYKVLNILFIFFSIYVCYNLFIVSEDEYKSRVVTEIVNIKKQFNDSDWAAIESKAAKRHQKLMYDSGFLETMKEMLIHKTNNAVDRAMEGKAMMWNYRLINNIQVLNFQMMCRVGLLEYWGVMLLPLFLCITFSGYCNYRIKQYQFGGSSVNNTRIALKMVWICALSSLVYLISPNFFGQFTYYLPVIVIVIFATSVATIITYYQKSS